jgi:hypothetical protein
MQSSLLIKQTKIAKYKKYITILAINFVNTLLYHNHYFYHNSNVMFKHEHILLVNTLSAAAQLLCSQCEQWPSNQGDLYLSAMGEVGSINYMAVDLLLILYCST